MQSEISRKRFPFQKIGTVPQLKRLQVLSLFKVTRTYLYSRWLCFWVAFFGRNSLTDFHNREWLNFKKMLFIFL